MPEPEPQRYDAVVIGTGFGGAVTAARLTQAGLRILVLERGMRYHKDDFPALPRSGQVLPDPARYAFSSREGRYGLWDVRDLDGAYAVTAAGYGGGSLIYANVQLKPPPEVFDDWPGCYRGDALAPYYDLAATMLDAQPISKSSLFPLRKTSALQAAADHLGRRAQRFDPPLAVNFSVRGQNAFGRAQAPCVGCGECDSGCRHGAKNTLDYNYLAIAEDARDGNQPLATIRTLAEVTKIQLSCDPQHRYLVLFDDLLVLEKHLPAASDWTPGPDGAETPNEEVERPRQVSALARYVFVCAGAAGSTELLFRSREALGLTDRPIGKRFFTNSDALGIVFGAEHSQEPSVGPVITTGIAYRGTRREDPWFLVQDGGYGAPVQAMVDAVFRSPGLLRRNLYDEALPGKPPPGTAPPGLAEGEPLGERPYQLETPYVRKNASIFEGLYHAEMSHQLTKLIPKDATNATDLLVKEARTEQVRRIGDLIEGMKPLLVSEITEHFVRLLSLGDPDGCRPFLRPLLHPLFALGARCIFWLTDLGLRGQKSLPAIAGKAFDDQYGLEDQRDAFMNAVRFLSRYRPEEQTGEPATHTAALLTMGRDLRGHTLRWDAEEEQLVATRIARSSLELASAQERALREIAAALGGKLRTNPLWSQGRAPVTVHAQGGCAMGDDAASVTDPNGEVRGAPGLFVMDASLFPSPVGVNPSATILAVAERNLERFIRAQVPGLKAWQAQVPAPLRVKRHPELAPPAIHTRKATPEPVLKPIGISFEEKLFGFHVACERFPITRYSRFEQCYIEGRQAGHTLDLEILVEIPDLMAFLEDPYRHQAKATGTLAIRELGAAGGAGGGDTRRPLPGLPRKTYPVEGTVELMQPTDDPDQRLYIYDLTWTDDSGAAYRLRGHKRLRDDPGNDAWKDTTSLFCVLHRKRSDERSAGVIRVSLDEFLFTEVPSFKVTGFGDDDEKNENKEPNPEKERNPARVLWALASFGAFFFGGLWRVYMREAGWAQRLLARSVKLGADDSVKPAAGSSVKPGAGSVTPGTGGGVRPGAGK